MVADTARIVLLRAVLKEIKSRSKWRHSHVWIEHNAWLVHQLERRGFAVEPAPQVEGWNAPSQEMRVSW